MEVLSIVSEHIEIFIILMIILVINFCCILFLVFKERKDDKKEINEILKEMNEPVKEIEKEQDKKLSENKKEVEEMLLKMQRDLESKPEDAVSSFENEQEEKSIISYQELLDSVKHKEELKVTPVKIETEKIEIEDEPVIEKPITKEPIIEEVITEDPIIRLEPIKEEKPVKKETKSMEFISPIFGKQEYSVKYPSVPKINRNENQIEEKTSNKNDEFLESLKQFRKSLD